MKEWKIYRDDLIQRLNRISVDLAVGSFAVDLRLPYFFPPLTPDILTTSFRPWYLEFP